MTDHDAIAARVRQDMKAGTPGPWVQDDITPAWINMHDCNGTWNVATAHMCCGYPVSGSDANARRIAALPDLEAAYLNLYDEVKRLRATGEIDRKFASKTADDVVSWKSRAEEAEAERDRLRAALEKCPPTSNPTLTAEYNLERIEAWWRLEVRPVLAKP